MPGDLDDLGVPGDRFPAGVVAGRVAGKLAPGPDLAAWLSLARAGELGDADLAATAGGRRRLASWAQARELAAVAQIASRSAARDAGIGTGEDGRPARVPASAAAEVALELAMSRYGASCWAGLAVELGWRLAATGAALESGDIDVYRARLIAEATGMLTDDAASQPTNPREIAELRSESIQPVTTATSVIPGSNAPRSANATMPYIILAT